MALCNVQRGWNAVPKLLDSAGGFTISRRASTRGIPRKGSDLEASNSQKELRPPLGRLIILRHGQSEWNADTDKSTARFTGWANVKLTELGRAQAIAAARTLRTYGEELHENIDCAVVSLLDRSQETLNLILQELDYIVHDEESGVSWPTIPVTASWRLNERHYGGLVGLGKSQAQNVYTKESLDKWRYSWYEPPPPMDEETLKEWRTYPHCQRITFVQNPVDQPQNPSDWSLVEGRTYCRTSGQVIMPASEAFGHVLERVLPFWERTIAPKLALGQNVLLVGHANSVKAMLHILDPKVVNPDTVRHVKIPNTTPCVYEMEAASPYDEDSLPGGVRVVAVRPSFWRQLDAPFDLEPRHALRATWLERAWIPAEGGMVLNPVDRPPEQLPSAVEQSLQSIAASA